MLLSIKKNYLLEYCLNALNTYFKDGEIVSERDLKKSFNILWQIKIQLKNCYDRRNKQDYFF